MHSWEEDASTEQVFRPESYDFKLSRRPRESFELKPDGTLILGEPSASDSLRESRGRWEIVEGDKLVFYSGAKTEAEKKMRIKSVSDDRLVVQVES
ncbi:MAG TPA: hypothetical protein VNH22_16170 [Blastocatellia bacterium]|nr:hypothetical protein [Blastocatellia bacterium]